MRKERIEETERQLGLKEEKKRRERKTTDSLVLRPRHILLLPLPLLRRFRRLLLRFRRLVEVGLDLSSLG